jgi:hypothetical protein
MTLLTFPVVEDGASADAGDSVLVNDWVGWLRERLDSHWRPGEWDAELLLFTGDPGNPRTRVKVCPLPSCGITVGELHSSGYCKICHDEFMSSGLTKPEFEAVYTRANRRLNVHRSEAICGVPACRRDVLAQGLCVTHYRSWVKARGRAEIDRDAWMASQRPAAEVARCRVLGCSRQRRSPRTGLCHTHQAKWRAWSTAGGAGEEDAVLAAWIERQPPYLSAHMFSLSPLTPVARLELLYALQQRDVRGMLVCPSSVRRVVGELSGLPCIAVADGQFPDPDLVKLHDLARALLRNVRWEIDTAFDAFRGVDPTRKLVWDLRTVSQQIPSLKKGVSTLRNPGMLDFGLIRQEWIREILMHWARTTHPISKNLRRWHKACVIASRALELRPDHGSDPSKLRFSDVTMVVDAYKLAHNNAGELYAPSHQGHLLGHFFDLLDFGRREGVAGDLSPSFVRHPGHHTIKQVDDNEDEIGKAIPDTIVDQLDQHLHLLGTGFPYGELAPEIVAEMFQTIYVILRDTGRRPAEIAGLDLDCLEADRDEYQLIWHNMKGRRLRRRLPILTPTVEAIKRWKQTRARLDLPRNSADHLFPAITSNYRHLNSGYISRAIRLWADSIPALNSSELGDDGTPLPFDRSKIFPYAFRHTFCQRYADAGVPLPVLQALMDHRSADTTAAYFQVSKKMKRQAVDTLRVLVLDRNGNPAPIGSATAYELRAVAVPWGNCVEPSNVKAGGKACPIRWQCPGCSHYRPDPSHLPAIEDQVRSLKANLEMARAMGTAGYSIAGLEGEITDYMKVIATMKGKMAAMTEEERQQVEEASKVLRRLRAAAMAPSPVPLPMPVVPTSQGAAS